MLIVFVVFFCAALGMGLWALCDICTGRVRRPGSRSSSFSNHGHE